MEKNSTWLTIHSHSLLCCHKELSTAKSSKHDSHLQTEGVHISTALHCSFVVFYASVCCLPFHAISTEHLTITQTASHWVLCFSGSLSIVLIYLWLIIFLSHSRQTNMMVTMSVYNATTSLQKFSEKKALNKIRLFTQNLITSIEQQTAMTTTY